MTIDQSNWKTSTIRYIAWLIASIGIVLDTIFVREAFLDILTLWQVRAVENMRKNDPLGNTARPGLLVQSYDTLIVFVLGMIAVGFAVWVEYFLRKGEQRGHMLPRLIGVFAVELAILAVTYLIQVMV